MPLMVSSRRSNSLYEFRLSLTDIRITTMTKLLTIFALGSWGDVQPYVALGVGLRFAGYRVRIATFGSFRPHIEGQMLEFHSVLGDTEAIFCMTVSNDLLNTDNLLHCAKSVPNRNASQASLSYHYYLQKLILLNIFCYIDI
jgi:Glycosyltransferase family 28 N-terminal domain